MKIHYAIEIETTLTTSVAAIGMTYGYIRFVTDRPIYTGTDTGTATIPDGDNSVINVTITDNTESMTTAIQSGELYTPSNLTFKSANTVLAVRDRFTVKGTGDFTGNDLAGYKGSAVAEGDMFEVVNNGSGTEVLKYVGINKWYEDFLVRDGMSNPSRRVDLLGTGDYGTLSGFNFTVDNSFIAGTGTPFWKAIDNNSVNLSQKTVRVYCVMDDDFYQIWTGIIDNNPRNDVDFKFVCKSNFKNVHKDLPPKTYNAKDYADAIDDITDEPVPVSLGDIEYAKVYNYNGDPAWVELTDRWFDSTRSFSPISSISDTAQATAYTNDATEVRIVLRTQGKEFAADELNGKYLFVLSGGGSPDTETGILILDSDATSSQLTSIVLAEPIENMDVDVYGYTTVPGSADIIDRWSFGIASVGVSGMVSNLKISSFKTDSTQDKLQLWAYDDNNTYVSYSKFVSGYSVENASVNSTATIDFVSTNITKDGDAKTLSQVRMEKQSSTDGVILDGDRSTSKDFEIPTGFHEFIDETVRLNVGVVDLADADRLFFGMDFTRDSDFAHDNNIKITVIGYDNYGREAASSSFAYPDDTNDFVAWTDDNFNMLPNSYYDNVGSGNGANGEASVFDKDLDEGTDIIKWAAEIPASILNGIKSGGLSSYLDFRIEYKHDQATGSGNFKLKLKQAGLLVSNVISFNDRSVYTRISGELLSDGTTETNTVYKAFRRMLEDYDGISANDIDYGNLATTRDDWYLGRQLVEKKNSIEYLKDLAQNSFVVMFQNRKGKTALTAWRDRTDSAHTHNNTTIIDGSISQFKLTPLDRVFNNFHLTYSINPAADKYFSQYNIKDVDADDADVAVKRAESEHPELWDVCNAAYDKYGVVRELKMALDWFIDRSRWYNSDDVSRVGEGVDGSAYKFLLDAVYHLTRKKRDTIFKLPVNTTNIVQELGDPVQFRDPAYTDSLTDSTYLTGWIYLIEYDIQNDQIIMGDMIKPADTIDEDYGDIIETGSASDTITESGSQSDTITEDGV